MEKYTELINVLNDLIRINIDRIKELTKRINDAGSNSEYVPLFKRLINESYGFMEQLVGEVNRKGGEVINRISSNSGMLYDSWKGLKSWIQQKKDLTVLEAVQSDIKAALKIYKEALFAVANIPADTLDLIATQKAHLREGCKEIEAELIINNHRNDLP